MTIQNYAIGALAVLVLVCMTYAGHVRSELAQSRTNERVIALRASNYEALHDSTRDLAREHAPVARLLGDSLRAYGKRVVQHEQPRDALDSALGGQHAGAYALRIAVETFHARVATVDRDTVTPGVTPFHVRQEPFTVDAVVSHLLDGDSTSLQLSVVLDTISLNARIQCSAVGDAGIRAASIVVKAPPWAAVRFGDVNQDPGVCNAPSERGTQRSRRFFSWAPIALSVGRQLGAGSTGWTAQIGTALTFGARE